MLQKHQIIQLQHHHKNIPEQQIFLIRNFFFIEMFFCEKEELSIL